MSSRDVRITPDTDGTVEFSVLGGSDDTGLMLLQRLYVLMLSDLSTGYRGADNASALSAYLVGGNIPSLGVLNASVAMACSDALDALDDEDRELIEEFSGYAETAEDAGYIALTLKLVDGTTITGAIGNV